MKPCLIKCRQCHHEWVSKNADPICNQCHMSAKRLPGIEFIRELDLVWLEWQNLFAVQYKSMTGALIEIGKQTAVKAKSRWKEGLTPIEAAIQEYDNNE